MKTIIILLTALLITAGSAMELSTNELYNNTSYQFSQQDEVKTDILQSAFSYEIESDVAKDLTITLEAALGYNTEGIHDDFHQEFGRSFESSINPSAEYTLMNNLSATIALPYTFNRIINLESDDSYATSTEFATETELSYSTLEEDLAGISPWESFEEGFSVAGTFSNVFYSEEEDLKADDLDYSIGGYLEYSYFNKKGFYMIKPSLSITQHLNEDVEETLEMEYSISSFKDLNKQFGISFEAALLTSREDSDADFEKDLSLAGTLLYYPTEIIELSLNLGYEKEGINNNNDDKLKVGLAVNYEIFAK